MFSNGYGKVPVEGAEQVRRDGRDSGPGGCGGPRVRKTLETDRLFFRGGAGGSQ